MHYKETRTFFFNKDLNFNKQRRHIELLPRFPFEMFTTILHLPIYKHISRKNYYFLPFFSLDT